MSSVYREMSPSPRLAPYVECFWTGEVVKDFSARVLPDGCADILFVARTDELIDVRLVGVMTRPHVVRLASGTFLLGVRFHPGMAGACLADDLQAFNDQDLPLCSVLGSGASDFANCFSRHNSVEAKTAAIENMLMGLPSLNSVQTAIGELVGRKGQLSLDDFAAAAGVGVRQLRHVCLKQSGLPPKQLARMLRFRHAITRIRSGEKGLAGLALRCGYYDQAHMIREFHNLAGTSPGRYLRQHER
jgi:AraC-like DNA-binding protein